MCCLLSHSLSFFSVSLAGRTDTERLNPYQEVIRICSITLEHILPTREIAVFGFGDKSTKDHSVFSFKPGNQRCQDLDEVLERYVDVVQSVNIFGPTSFGPAIRAAMDIVQKTHKYHVLIIIADGQVDRVQDTVNAIVEATNYPLSIVCVGVGDGPWDEMERFDDELPQRRFDNFQFVNFTDLKMTRGRKVEISFALSALMEIPDQHELIRRFGYLNAHHPLQPVRSVNIVDPPYVGEIGRGLPMGGGNISFMPGVNPSLSAMVTGPGSGYFRNSQTHLSSRQNIAPAAHASQPHGAPHASQHFVSLVPMGGAAAAIPVSNFQHSGAQGVELPAAAPASQEVGRSQLRPPAALPQAPPPAYSGAVDEEQPERGNVLQDLASVSSEEETPEIPKDWICPISSEPMRDPVTCSDGFTYERALIEAWFSNHDTSPMTGERLTSKECFPCHALRNTIRDWLEQHPGHQG